MSDSTPPPREPSAPGPDSATQPLTPAPDLSATVERTVVQQLDDLIAARLRGAGSPPAAGYRMLRKLGEGTYGTVWLAEDKAGVRVAIKFFAHGAGQQWQLLQSEVQSLARLDTTFGIVQLKEVEPDADPPYFVMSYAEGGSLQQKLADGPLPPREALRHFTEIARALAFVHAKGIRHCDLKPANVLLNQHGQPMIADFGQAHLSDDASPALGTFFYMAPEQSEPGLQLPDARWDVYGLGAIFYALLTGGPPHKNDALADELRQTVKLHHRLRLYRERIRAMPQPTEHRRVAGVDGMLAGILDRCLELNPAERLRDAGAVLDALETRRRQRRQRPMLLFGTLAPLLVLALMVGVGSLAARDALAEARAGLTRQLLDSDQVTAQLAAKLLEDKLRDGVTVIGTSPPPARSRGWPASSPRWRPSARPVPNSPPTTCGRCTSGSRPGPAGAAAASTTRSSRSPTPTVPCWPAWTAARTRRSPTRRDRPSCCTRTTPGATGSTAWATSTTAAARSSRPSGQHTSATRTWASG